MAKQIKPNEAKVLCDNFDTKYKALCTITKNDNRSNLFTLQELKNYINYLENTDANIDGIRIYLGAYGADKNNLSTVFLVPTANKIDNTELDVLNYGGPGNPTKTKYS